MHRMNHFLYACGFLFMGIMGQALNAQEAATSRLTVGADIGFVFKYQMTDSMSTAIDAHTVQLRSSYRFYRWLGVSAQIGYGRVSEASSFFIVTNIIGRRGEPWTFARTTHRIPAVLGPELNLRIGQGDLSASAQFGVIYNQSKVFLMDLSQEYVLKYTPTLDIYNSLSFSYTYWPQQQFGVRIGVQFQDWLPNSYSSSSLQSKSKEQYPDLEPEISNSLRPRTTALGPYLFQIGLTYRL